LSAVRDSGLSIIDPVGYLFNYNELLYMLAHTYPYKECGFKEPTIKEFVCHIIACMAKMSMKHNAGGHTALTEHARVLLSFSDKCKRGHGPSIFDAKKFLNKSPAYCIDPDTIIASEIIREVCSVRVIQ